MGPARYGLRGENRMVALAQWREMDGFFVGRDSAYDAYENPTEEPATVRATLRGVDWLDAAVDRPTRTLQLGEAVLEVLGADGRVLGDYALWDAELTVPADATDATLTARVDTLPHAGARWAWDRRREGLSAPGGWAAAPVGDREGWVEAARIVALRSRRDTYPTLGEQHELDGRHIDDLASLFCAVGEAFDGPGGFCGASIPDLSDLRYAPRTVSLPRLVWHDIAVARQSLARAVEAEGQRTTYFELVRGALAAGGVQVIEA